MTSVFDDEVPTGEQEGINDKSDTPDLSDYQIVPSDETQTLSDGIGDEDFDLENMSSVFDDEVPTGEQEGIDDKSDTSDLSDDQIVPSDEVQIPDAMTLSDGIDGEEHVINMADVMDNLIVQPVAHTRPPKKKWISYMILFVEIAAFAVGTMGMTMSSMVFTMFAMLGFIHLMIHSSSFNCMLLVKLVAASVHAVSCLTVLCCEEELLGFSAAQNAKVHGLILGISILHYFTYGD